MQIYRAVTQRPRVLALGCQTTKLWCGARHVFARQIDLFWSFPLFFCFSVKQKCSWRPRHENWSLRMDTDNPLLAARPGHDAVLIRHLLQSKLESFSTLWMCLFLFYYVTHSITILKRTGVFVVVCLKQSLQEYSRLSTQTRWCRSTSVPSYSGWDVSSPAEPRDLVRLHSRNIASHTYHSVGPLS